MGLVDPCIAERSKVPNSTVLNSMYRSGLVDTLVTHANMKRLGLTPLFGDPRGFMPPQLKAKQTFLDKNCQKRP